MCIGRQDAEGPVGQGEWRHRRVFRHLSATVFRRAEEAFGEITRTGPLSPLIQHNLRLPHAQRQRPMMGRPRVCTPLKIASDDAWTEVDVTCLIEEQRHSQDPASGGQCRGLAPGACWFQKPMRQGGGLKDGNSTPGTKAAQARGTPNCSQMSAQAS